MSQQLYAVIGDDMQRTVLRDIQCIVKPQHIAMSITNQAKGKSIQFIN